MGVNAESSVGAAPVLQDDTLSRILMNLPGSLCATYAPRDKLGACVHPPIDFDQGAFHEILKHFLHSELYRSLSLHHKPYSVVSYAWNTRYQQSNQWAIETLALAMEPGVASRQQAQAWLALKAYEPTTLKLGPLTRLGARATAANVAFDDHPNDKRFADRIETVTVDSVFIWLQRSGLALAPQSITAP